MYEEMLIEKIEKALKLNEMAYDTVRNSFRRGMSERDVKQLIASACGNYLFTGDLVGGVRSSAIEGDATDYILQEGDTLILDLQFQYEGIWTDTTRTFFIGTPTRKQMEIYDVVCRAKQAGEAALKNNVRACEVYHVLKTALTPYEEMFPHHAGHLFCLEPVMQPQFLPDKYATVSAGDFVTLEPGIYLEDEFGIRVEDDYLITQDGCCKLFDYTVDIKDFIL